MYMKKKSALVTLVVLIGATFFGAGVAFSQFWSETPSVVHLSKAEMDQIYKSIPDPTKSQDQAAFIMDMGPYNVGVNTQHRTGPQEAGADGSIEFHAMSAELYYILEGSGTLTTQEGSMTNVKTRAYSREDQYKRLTDGTLQFNSPTGTAIFSGKTIARHFTAGDIIIIPPNTGHRLSGLDGKFVDYLVFRVDPYHSMPAGYVNPLFRKAGKMKPEDLGSGSSK
jgi:mannose-6-phosphate isomerase-like protein (cupin superfamily)